MRLGSVPRPAGPQPQQTPAARAATTMSFGKNIRMFGSKSRGRLILPETRDERAGRSPRGRPRRAPAPIDQYESALRTSPPAMVPRPYQVTGLTVFLQKWTLPSANRALTPPGWLL